MINLHDSLLMGNESIEPVSKDVEENKNFGKTVKFIKTYGKMEHECKL